MVQNTDKDKIIRIKESTKLQLDIIGKKTDSYDNVIKRLIEEYNGQKSPAN